MDIEYKDVIDCSKLKRYLKDDGRSIVWLANKSGIDKTRLSAIVRNVTFPKPDTLAKLACTLKVPVSEIIDFKFEVDDKKAAWFRGKVLPYTPSENAEGELTYEPLRIMTQMYLDYINGLKNSDKTLNDLFDLIIPYRKRNGMYNITKEAAKAALKARGFEEGYKSKRTGREYNAKGLTPLTRTKLKFDRPVNLRTIYDICNFFGCNIDWVMSYK